MHGLMSDTPSLEKNGWTGDGQASASAASVNFGMARVWTKWLADFRDAQAASGELPEIVPSTPYYGFDQTPGWSYIWGPTPSWDAAMFVISADMLRHYGDERIIADMYASQKRLSRPYRNNRPKPSHRPARTAPCPHSRPDPWHR